MRLMEVFVVVTRSFKLYLCSMATTTYPWEARSQQMLEDTVRIPPIPWAKTITGNTDFSIGPFSCFSISPLASVGLFEDDVMLL